MPSLVDCQQERSSARGRLRVRLWALGSGLWALGLIYCPACTRSCGPGPAEAGPYDYRAARSGLRPRRQASRLATSPKPALRCRNMSDATFPIDPPIEPMLAKLATELPTGDNLLYEPKWDGFRALIFRSGDDVYIQSRDLRP